MFTVIDIETTGLSKHRHKITEIAAAKVENHKIVDTFSTLVNPEVRIPSFITRLTGIDNEMTDRAPTIGKVLPAFKDFLGKDVFVAHNATFDFGFLEHQMHLQHKQEILNPKLCTKKLANRILPDLPRKRLQDLCAHFEVENQAAHRAMGDVQATVQVFNGMCNILHEKGIQGHDIVKFERLPVHKCFSEKIFKEIR